MYHSAVIVTVLVIIASFSNSYARLYPRYSNQLKAKQSYYCRPKVCECNCRTQAVCQTVPNADKVAAQIKEAITTEIKKIITAELKTNTTEIKELTTELKKAIGAWRHGLVSTHLHPKKHGHKKLKYGKPIIRQKIKGIDCAELYKKGIRTNGVYQIRPYQSGPKAHQPILAYCDMKTDGGGWTVFQRRQDGHLDFYRNWAAYKAGFGNPKGEHWLGNDVIHALTYGPSHTNLRVELEQLSGQKAFAKYGVFSVGDSKHKYILQVGRYSGTAGDSLSYNSGYVFSTYDKDNSKKCALKDHGGWWYNNCTNANLNGRYYYDGSSKSEAAIIWRHWSKMVSLVRTEMKVRPRSFSRR